MKFFKEYNKESKEVPSLPTRYGGVEAKEYSFETVHPGVGALNYPAFLIHFLIKQICLTGISPVSSVRTDVGYDSMGIQCNPEILSVKACVKIGEKSVNGNARCRQLCRDLINPVLYLKKVGVLPL